MSGLILCGRQSKTPYYIKETGINVYSLEEINYFIYNNIHLVYRSFFNSELFDYIEKELGRADIAEQMRRFEQQKALMKDFISFLFKSTQYFSQTEMSRITPLVMNIDTMTEAERRKMTADRLYDSKKYGSACRIYSEILAKRDKEKLPGSFFAQIAYSIGIIYAKLYMGKTANYYFRFAYELNPEPKYAKACVYMSILNNDEEELLDTIVRYKITDESLSVIKSAVESARTEIENSDETAELANDFSSGTNYQKIIEKWKQEYYTMQS